MATLSDLVESEVRARLLRGELGPGMQVRQDALAEALGTSRIPVREALTRLEREGLLVLNHHRGFEVRRLDRSEILEIFQLRLALEPAATAAAARCASPSEQRLAAESLARLDEEMERGGERVPEYNLAFHRALIAPCARPLTLQFIERLLALVRAQVGALPRVEIVKAEHEALLGAWRARDEERTKQLAADHIRSGMRQLRLDREEVSG